MKPAMMGIVNMTEQLEIIRAKFEALHPVPNWMFFNVDEYLPSPDWAGGIRRERVTNYQSLWQGYLSCMSQEIELPWGTCEHDELVDSLEAQGYRVKR